MKPRLPRIPVSWQYVKLPTKSLAPERFSAKGGQLIWIMSPHAYRSRVSSELGNASASGYQVASTALIADGDKLEVLAKDLPDSETLEGSQIKKIVAHGRLINPPSSSVPPAGKKISAKRPSGLLGLTARETEVLAWIV